MADAGKRTARRARNNQGKQATDSEASTPAPHRRADQQRAIEGENVSSTPQTPSPDGSQTENELRARVAESEEQMRLLKEGIKAYSANSSSLTPTVMRWRLLLPHRLPCPSNSSRLKRARGSRRRRSTQALSTRRRRRKSSSGSSKVSQPRYPQRRRPKQSNRRQRRQRSRPRSPPRRGSSHRLRPHHRLAKLPRQVREIGCSQ